MSNITLSKDADYLICIIYKYYLELRDNGFSKSDVFDKIKVVQKIREF